MRSFLVVSMSVGVLWLGGCSTNAEPEASPYEAALRQASTCEEVLEAIQADEMAKVDLELKQFLDQDGYYRFGGPLAVDGAFGGASGQPPELDAESPTSGDGDAPDGFSDTNRQVADVDEADIVKVGDEGRKLYVIRGNGFYEFDSWPAAETAMAADLEIEGYPLEMFVHGDRAVVFSSVYSVEGLDDGDLCPDYFGGPEPAVADGDIEYYCGRSYVKATVIDISGDSNEVVRELFVDGWYSSSRRHDDIVRVVVQSNMQRPASVPNLYGVVYDGQADNSQEAVADRARAWAVLAKDEILATTLEQWLPAWGERVDGEMTELPFQCADFYSPAPGLTNYGLSQVLGLDINDAERTALTSILGQASQVYANSDTLVLAQPDWAWYDHDVDFDRTSLHRFVVSSQGERTPYQGSGFVEGIVNDQFSIDERDGVIRVATTRTTYAEQPIDDVRPDIWIAPVTHNLVSALRLEDGQLQVVGKTPDLAEGERIFSARFLGDLGYIVTFRQVDPLFAIELSDPENLTVLGELKIPGFSDYMHPLGPDHLLTIGRDIDEQTQVDRGTALQIFDVSDPTNPTLAHKSLVGDGYSQANHNHKAFNFYAGESADAGVLAFPFVSYDSGFSSTLELWDVSAETGFDRHGAVDHSDLVVDECGGGIPFEDFYGYCGYAPEIMRGVFIDEYIYSISHGGIRVHQVEDLTPIATAPF